MALAVLVAFVGYGLIDMKIWKDPSPTVIVGLLAAIGLGAFLESVRGIVTSIRAPRRASLHHDLDKAVLLALVKLSQAKDVSLEDLGGSLFMVNEGARWVPARWRERWAWSRPYLERVTRTRVADSPQATEVEWTRGKGAIGECWEKDRCVHRDWRHINERYNDGSLTRERFRRMNRETRNNFTFEEFQRILGKYAEVLAVPMRDKDGHLVGVVSVDLAAREGKHAAKILHDEEAERAVESTAIGARVLLNPR